MADAVSAIVEQWKSKLFDVHFSELKRLFQLFVEDSMEPSPFLEVYILRAGALLDALRQVLYLCFKIAKKDEAFFVQLAAGIPLEVLQKLVQVGLESKPRLAMVGTCAAVALLPHLWKQDLRACIQTLDMLPAALERFQVELPDAQTALLAPCLTYAKQILERVMLNPNNSAVLINSLTRCIETHGLPICFDVAEQFNERWQVLPPALQRTIFAPNVRTQALDMLKSFCLNSHAMDGLTPGMSPMAMMTQLLRNSNDSGWKELQSLQGQMTEMATVVQSMNPGERQALISQAMQMMTPMMQGSVDPQQFQQIEGSAAEMFNVFANSPSQNDGNTK
jgi:hypothetical protein